MFGKGNIAIRKKPVPAKLIAYGFEVADTGYTFSKSIMAGAFRLIVLASESATTYKVVDTDTGEDYVLVYMPDVNGAFVGEVRAACEQILSDILNQCYEPAVFQSPQTLEAIDYIRVCYGINPEYLWEKLPNHAALRESKHKKWFGTLSRINAIKVGWQGNEMIELLGLKETPENIARLVDGKRYLAGYHMNKKYWYCVPLNGILPMAEIRQRIDTSFQLLSKKK